MWILGADLETLAVIKRLLGGAEEQQAERVEECIDILEPPEEASGESAADLEPDLEPVGRLRWEPVNVELLNEALELDAVRRMKAPFYEAFDVLLSIRRRVLNVKGRLGWIPVLERESPSVNGEKRRVYSGIDMVYAGMPREIQNELDRGIPENLVGRSAFHFSRAIKYLVRGNLGMGEYDLNNSLFEVLRRIAKPLPAAVLYYCDCREEVLQKLAEYLTGLLDRSVTAPMCKKLMISIGFGGTLYGFLTKELGGYKAPSGEWNDYMKDFEAGMRSIRDSLAEKNLELLEAFADRPFPKASLLYSLYEKEERDFFVAPNPVVDLWICGFGLLVSWSLGFFGFQLLDSKKLNTEPQEPTWSHQGAHR